VAPGTDKGATSRALYLPRGSWYDYWCKQRVEGGREIHRPVDLATIPLHVRAGAIIPFGPIKQFTAEDVDGPLSLSVYPGADGHFLLYEDDGVSFNYRKGDWMGIELIWDDSARKLTMKLTDGSQMRPPLERRIEVRLIPGKETRSVVFAGKPIEIRW
jgi:alpha-glucosidase (family GH31 glycosyl hydrolase)